MMETIPYKCKWYKSATYPTGENAVEHRGNTQLNDSYPCASHGKVFKQKQFLTSHVCTQLQKDSCKEESKGCKTTSKPTVKSKREIKGKVSRKENVGSKTKTKKKNELVL